MATQIRPTVEDHLSRRGTVENCVLPRLCGDNSLAEGTGLFDVYTTFATEPEPKSASWRPLYGGFPSSSVVVKPLRKDYDWSHPRISAKRDAETRDRPI